MLDTPNDDQHERWGVGTAGLTEADELAIVLGDQAIAVTLTPRQMREFSRSLVRAAKRIEIRQRGSNA